MSELKILETSQATYYSNDIKLAAALVSVGLPIVSIKERNNPRNNKPEILFGFEQTDAQRVRSMEFLSGKLMVDARTIMDNRDALLSFVSNGSREIIEQLNKPKK